MITDVGIDLDGVMYDFATEFRKYCAFRLGRTDLPEPRHWEFYEDWGLDKDTFYSWLTEATVNDELFFTGKPYDNTIEGWQKLRSMGMRIHVLTHRHIEAVAQTSEWLRKHNFIPDSLHFGFDKAHLEGLAIDQAAAIDDYTKYYDEYEETGVKAFLRNQPWNSHHHGRRVDDLLDFANAVETYNKFYEWEECKTIKALPRSPKITTSNPANYEIKTKWHPHIQPNIWKYKNV